MQEKFTEFEDQLVTMCQMLTESTNSHDAAGGHMDTTLLHLSASLGMSRLTCSLIHWSAESGAESSAASSALSSRTRLCREVDALALDNQGFTPLVGKYNQRLICPEIIISDGCFELENDDRI